MPVKPIRVLVVDDSALIRKLLTEILSAAPNIEVVGTAGDPYIARRKIKKLDPDVLTLDVEMPRMDGLTFLENLMRLRPMPVVMVSTLTEQGAQVTLDALELGAIDFVTKPKIDVRHTIHEYAEELIGKIEAAARARVRRLEAKADAAEKRLSSGMFDTTDKLLAIGASTGGTTAISHIVTRFPADAPGTVIVQHIPGGFSRSFANRVNDLSAVRVVEAEDGMQIMTGNVYIAPGTHHLRVQRSGARFLCRLSEDAPVSGHRPSVDVLFESVAQQVGHNAVGVLLTGMGADGARGLLAMRRAGAPTIAQDEATSVVWGMPGRAVDLDAAQQILPLDQIASAALEAAIKPTDLSKHS
ncbi:chemotaxis response regulator protein-glutamate methylesterase [Persicimonas caeni]|uniref:Protein-glutamate methylesterase/protein-glutamine glutaminase n=1 Tax=Persicimonas caeni TaxID=2292766 RepID=A0A4Y6Q394_PERCE|nr:chemotaxis response regulator protein-glutamate methylesterase [Persicimonas caeni]QED36171.1 chemotaxis response regulator protein-glutamate methylesterase [Persicimonas caeni]